MQWQLHWFFLFNETATTEIYTLSLHDALPIFLTPEKKLFSGNVYGVQLPGIGGLFEVLDKHAPLVSALKAGRLKALTSGARSEEHTSELQSLAYLVCRLLLEKKKAMTKNKQSR